MRSYQWVLVQWASDIIGYFLKNILSLTQRYTDWRLILGVEISSLRTKNIFWLCHYDFVITRNCAEIWLAKTSNRKMGGGGGVRHFFFTSFAYSLNIYLKLQLLFHFYFIWTDFNRLLLLKFSNQTKDLWFGGQAGFMESVTATWPTYMVLAFFKFWMIGLLNSGQIKGQPMSFCKYKENVHGIIHAHDITDLNVFACTSIWILLTPQVTAITLHILEKIKPHLHELG